MDGENNEVSIDINKVGGSRLIISSIVAEPVVEEDSHFQTPTSTVTRPKCHKEMYKAALQGDWKAAKVLLREDPNLARAEIRASGAGALHVAAANKHTEFVRELVKLMSPNDLLLRNKQGLTAFCYAAESGIEEIADVMRMKNPSLVTERGKDLKTALHIATFFANKKMVKYLFKFTREEDLSRDEWFDLLIATIRSRMFDVALDILNMDGSLARSLATKSNEKGTALHHLVQPVEKKKLLNYLNPDLPESRRDKIERQSQDKAALSLAKELWAVIQTLGRDEVTELVKKPFSILHEAVKEGNLNLINMIVRSDPHGPHLLLLKDDIDNDKDKDKDEHTILQTAVLYRQVKVFDLIRDMGYLKGMLEISVDKDDNNILHLAADSKILNSLKEVSEPAFEMEREIKWYTEVKKVVPISYRKMKNKDGLIPREVFNKEHHELLGKVEKWMKEASNSYMLIATLIATVASAAAITLPGGNKRWYNQTNFY